MTRFNGGWVDEGEGKSGDRWETMRREQIPHFLSHPKSDGETLSIRFTL